MRSSDAAVHRRILTGFVFLFVLVLPIWNAGREAGWTRAADLADLSGQGSSSREDGGVRAIEKAGAIDEVETVLVEQSEFDAQDIAATGAFVETLNLADWLGPLAPVALSPFFAMAGLSGLSIWGPEWLEGNAMLSASGPLHSRVVFSVFAVLTLLTSIPRFAKVSKPFAQAMDQVESYSVIVTLLVVKFLADMDFGAGAEPEPVAMVQLGVFSFTADTLLAIAMVINLVVINTVKFFFEVLIWLTPIPAIDAMFELANKAVCAALLAVYTFSPTLATAINLVILAAASLVFRWVYRRVGFYRSVLTDLLLPRLWSPYGKCRGSTVTAFVREPTGPYAAKTRWRLEKIGDEGDAPVWRLHQLGTLKRSEQTLTLSQQPQIRSGWLTHSLVLKVSGSEPLTFVVTRRYDGDWDGWLSRCHLVAERQRDEEAMATVPVKEALGRASSELS